MFCSVSNNYMTLSVFINEVDQKVKRLTMLLMKSISTKVFETLLNSSNFSSCKEKSRRGKVCI